MNLNNWLCKHFDKNKKGYVTVGEFFEIIIFSDLAAIACIAVLVFVVGGAFFGMMQGMDNGQINTFQELIIILLKAWIKPAVVVGSFGVVLYCVYKVSQIKIAKCRLKGDDYQTVSGGVSNDDNKQFQK